MKRLIQYFKGYVKESVLGPLFKLCEALLELIVPMLVAAVIDTAIPSKDHSLLLFYIFAMVVVGIIGFTLSLSAQYFSAKAAVGFTKQLNEALFKKIIYLPQSTVDKMSPASLINRVTSDTFQIQTGINIFFRLFLRSPFIVLGSLMLAVQIDVSMTMIFMLMIILLFLSVFGVLKVTTPMFADVRKKLDRLVQHTREQMKGIRVIRAFRQEEREINEFSSINDQINQQQLKVLNISILTNPLTYIIVNSALILVIWQGGKLVNIGNITQGELVALVNYLLAILVELIKLTMVITVINKSFTSAKRVVEVLNMEEEDIQFEGARILDSTILYQFNNTELQYPNTQVPALRALNFSIKKGEFIGIIGGTGSGKSTLIELITKSYDPTGGEIMINQRMLRTNTRQEVRNLISLVPQTVSLFKGTIRSNLLFANPHASEKDMWHALKVAQAEEFVREKEGLDTIVTAFGRNFSGGQRQRLTIARALIKPAEIYIFDDSTSALDYLTEANFQKDLKAYYGDKTIIMISQRTHSVKAADNILVLNEGQQIDFNTHEVLLENCLIYQEIHQSQQVVEVENHE